MLRMILDILRDHSYMIQKSDTVFCEFKKNKHRLVILLGASTSGKSSIARGIIKAFPEIVELDFDTIFQRMLIEYLLENFNERFLPIWTAHGVGAIAYIFHDLPEHAYERCILDRRTLLALRADVIGNLKGFSHKVRSTLADLAKKAVKSRRVVLCQAIGLNGLNYFADFQRTVCLVHCSLEDLSQRVEQRNGKALGYGDFSNLREYASVHKQVSKINAALRSKEAMDAPPNLDAIQYFNCSESPNLFLDDEIHPSVDVRYVLNTSLCNADICVSRISNFIKGIC